MLDYDIDLDEEWKTTPQADNEAPIYTSGNPIADMINLGKTLAECKAQKKVLESQATELENTIESMSIILHRMIKSSGLENLNISGVGLVSPTIKKYPKIVDQDALKAFFKKHKLMDLMKLTIHPKTLKSWLESSELPELSNPSSIGLSVYEKKSVSIRKGK